MNASAIKEGSNPIFAGIAVAIVGGVIGFFTAVYTANYGAQINATNAAMFAQTQTAQAQALKIERLEVDDANSQTSIANLNAAVSQLSGIKPAVEAQTRALEDLQRKVDAIDHWLRPDPTLGVHH